VTGRPTYVSVEAVSAVCNGCAWRNDARNALGTGAQHHDRTGHEVVIEQVTRITYGDAPAPEDLGQTTLEGTA
jgi:hypothetical protein